MAPQPEGSRLKRGLPASLGEEPSDSAKKPRRSERIRSHAGDTPLKDGQLPSPLTHLESTTTEITELGTASGHREVTPPSQTIPQSQFLSPPRQHAGQSSQNWPQLSQTQPWSQSQFLPPSIFDYEVEDEEEEGVWGYLIAQDAEASANLILRKRAACPLPKYRTGRNVSKGKVARDTYEKAESKFEGEKLMETPSGGYLMGRHPECDRIVELPQVSNRHCLIFSESKGGDIIAVLEDLSTNGTYICNSAHPFGEAIGRNKRVELQDGDIIALLRSPETDLLMAKFEFRYPRNRATNSFHQQYTLLQQLGKGHFATVYLCVEKCSTMRYAVKKFDKRHGPGEKSRVEGLQQEIAVLMSVSHPSLLCLKDTFDEEDGVYLVLELAPEGELFNWIVMKKKLSEAEARKVFVQLFQAVKYLHERNIVHRDIKPENILMVDKNLTVKLADFGLAKIIGEESFTTTLCGTPSYVAPEILRSSSNRRYTRAVDVWSLGVVLYICLCGFPPFSDELYSAENPYTLAQQIMQGRFDYPSPYWDSVGDPALDLIDKMLTVDPDNRYTVDECLQHPWTTGRELEPTQMSYDSTDGLTGAIEKLDFSKRKPVRERTLLSELNDVRVTRVVEPTTDSQGNNVPAVKIFEKNRNKPFSPSQKQNHNGNGNGATSSPDSVDAENRFPTPVTSKDKTVGTSAAKTKAKKEPGPAHNRAPDEFMALGGGPDQPLFGDDGNSRYISPDTEKEIKKRAAKRKKKAVS